MLDELKDFVQKKIFTEKETKEILKKRTAFESALIRRVAKKSDYLRYISYEMNLEQLRKKRVQRLNIERGPATVSDYALVRRQFNLFERALKKFKSDVGLWIQYIEVAKRNGARTLVGRITARALQLHPNNSAFYILAASHELDHLSPSTARSLLQRGLRINSRDVKLWQEYMKMELGFVESLRRRWDVLGIKPTTQDTKGKEKDGDFMTSDVIDDDIGGNLQVDDLALEGEDTRKAILAGAIIKSVIDNAVETMPSYELFDALNSTLMDYPGDHGLRQGLLDYLHGLVKSHLPNDGRAMKLLASRFLTAEIHSEEFVQGLKRANEEMMQTVSASGEESASETYASFVEEWCEASIDENLKHYLVSSLKSCIARLRQKSPILLSAHLRLLVRFVNADWVKADRTLRIAEKYTAETPNSAQVWLARLMAINACHADASQAWREARRCVRGSEEEMEKVWTWGLSAEMTVEERRKAHEVLLRESMGDASLHGLHERLLMGYVRSELTSDQVNDWATWLDLIRHMGGAYLTTGKVWQMMFVTIAKGGTPRVVLEEAFRWWSKADEREARLEWARWLLRNGQGKEASEAVGGGGAELERRWLGILGNGTI